MTKTSKLSLPVALVLAAFVTAQPALAQGNGKGNGNGNGNGKGRGNDRDRVEQVRRDRDRDRDDARLVRRDRDGDDRWERRSDRYGTWEISRDRRTLRRNGRDVPRGWCQGRGNPHNTPENCGGWRYSQNRSVWDWIGIGGSRTDDRRWDDRVYSRTGRTSSSGGSYSGSHSEYHRWHDQVCADRARGASLSERLRIAAQCKAEHDDWHRQTGTRH